MMSLVVIWYAEVTRLDKITRIVIQNLSETPQKHRTFRTIAARTLRILRALHVNLRYQGRQLSRFSNNADFEKINPGTECENWETAKVENATKAFSEQRSSKVRKNFQRNVPVKKRL